MATVAKRKVLVNSAKRRMTEKQVRFFGTPAQKAALKRKKAKNRASSRPATKPKARKKPTARPVKANVGEIVSFLTNSAKMKRPTMAKTNTKPTKKNSAARRPAVASASRPKTKKSEAQRRRIQRNPGGKIMQIAEQAGGTLAGAVASRALTQVVLKNKNQGALGYAANAGIGWGLSKVAHMLTKSQNLEHAILIGTGVGLILRYASENSPWGKYLTTQLSGLGDVGLYMDTGYFTPTQYADDGTTAGSATPVLPAFVTADTDRRIAAARPVPTAARAGVGSLADGVGGRYSARGRYA